jgi:hypothetical protein
MNTLQRIRNAKSRVISVKQGQMGTHRIIHKITEQDTWEAQNQGTTDNSQYWALQAYFGKC